MRLSVLALILAGCVGTEQAPITYPISAVGTSGAIVTDSGWSVTLTKATASFDAVRFFEGKVLLSQRPSWWQRLSPIGTAWAHPGHYIAGEALGELIAPIEIDLLAKAPASWGIVDGVTAEYGSAQLTYATAGFVAEGTASKDGVTVEFSASFTPPSTIEGCKYEQTMTTDPTSVALAIDLNVVFSRVDFAQIGSGAKPLDQTSPAYNGFGRGIEDTSAYVFTKE